LLYMDGTGSGATLWVYNSGTVSSCKVGLFLNPTTSVLSARFPADATSCTVTFAPNTLVAMNTRTRSVVVNAASVALTATAMPTSNGFTPVFTSLLAVHTKVMTTPGTGTVTAVDYTGTNTRSYTAAGVVVGPDTSPISSSGCFLQFSINSAGQVVVASANGFSATVSATPFTCAYTLASGTLTVTTSTGTVYVSSASVALTFAPTSATVTYTQTSSTTGTLTYKKAGASTNAAIQWMSMSWALGSLDYPPVLLNLVASPDCAIILTLQPDGSTVGVTAYSESTPPFPPCSVTLSAATYAVVVNSIDATAGTYVELLQVSSDVAITLDVTP
jgi:hypothetical protein